MSFFSRLQNVSDSDKARAVRQLVEDSTPDFDFFLMVVLSVLMATFGLLAGSETVVIGSMLIAPLLHPIIGLALGISMSDQTLIRRSTRTVLKAIAFAIGASALATFFFSMSLSGSEGYTDVILSRTQPSLLFLVVAIISGLAVAYALVRPGLSETLPGVAVSVALIPPLAVVGVGIGVFDWSIVAGSAVMFAINVVGIVGAAMFAFSLMDVHKTKHVAQSTMKKEDERVAEETLQEKVLEAGEHVEEV